MRRWRSFLKQFIIGLGVLLAVLTLLVLAENIRGRIALHLYMRQLRAQGEKLTLAEFDLPKPSREAISAATDLTVAGKELEAVRRKFRPGIVGQVGLWRIIRGRSVVRHQQPDLGSPRLKPATWDDLDEQLSSASNALAHVKAALRNGNLAVRVDLSHIDDTDWSYLDATCAAADWLNADAIADLHRGDVQAAVENIAFITTLTQFQRHAPLLNSQYARLHVAQVGLHATWETLQAVGATEEQLARLQSMWESYGFSDAVLESLEGERVWRLSRFERVRRSPKAFGEVCKGEMSCCHECGGTCDLKDLWFDTRAMARVAMWRLAWLDQDGLEFLKEWQVCLDQAREAIAYGDRTRFRSNEIARVPRRNWYDRRRYLMSQQLAPMDEMMVLQPMYVETERRMAVAAIALKRFDLAHGAWPDALMELTPTFLTDVPRDFMDGQPLRYRRNEDGAFTLYSVGQNCLDDGGSVERDRDHLPNGMMWMTCDAVWPTPASRAEVAAAQTKW